MKFKTFILTFLMMMSCSISFGQGSSTGSATTEAQLWMHLNDDEIGTISLANDIKITVTCPIPNGKKVTIDLNGYELFTEEEIYIINNEGKLTITDNSEGKTGTISSTLGIYNGVTPTRTSVNDVKYDRVLTINGGVFNSSSTNGNAATIYNYRGVIKINGGEFYGEHSAITNYGMATIANAYIECLNRDNGAAAIINDYEIAYGENVNIVGRYTTVTETAYTTGTEPTYLFAELNGTKYPSLQAALDACTTGNNTINLLFHNSYNATVSQKEGVNITIDGNGYKDKQFEYTGTIYVNGNSRHTGTETLTIQDVNFVTTDNKHDFISCNSGTDPVIRYAHNVTVQNCNFTATQASTEVVALRFRQSYNINVVDSEFTNLHSAMWATGTSGIAFDNIEATNCKEGGISAGTSTPVYVKNSTIAGAKYGVRADGSGAYSLTVENSTLEAEVPVIVRNTTGEYSLTVKNDATLTATNGGPQVVVTAGKDNEAYVTPTSDVNVTLYDNVTSTFGLTAKIGNAFYATLQDAVDNAKTGETVTLIADNCKEDVTVNQAPNYAITIDGDGKTFKGTITVDGKSARYETTALTIKNVNFDATEGISADACINLGAEGNGNTRYTNKVTVESCTFTDNDYTSVAVKSYTGGDWNLVVKDCEANGMHSLAQLANVEKGLVISGNTADTKNGINLNQTAVGTIEGNIINVKGYAVRAGVDNSNGGNITLNENTLKTDNTESDPVIELRGTVVALNMEKNVVSGNTHIKGTAGTISVDANYWDGKEAPVVAEGSTPIVVNSYYSDEACTNLVRNEMGSIYAFVSSDRIFGDVTTNAKESIKIEIIGKDGNPIGTSSLQDLSYATGFNKQLTWRINLGDDDSDSWAMTWEEGCPSINNMPTKVKLYVDAKEGDAAVAEAEIRYTANGDGESPVFAAKTNAEGKINSFIACTGEFNLSNANTFLKEALTAGDNVAITVAGTYAVPTGKNLTITGAVDGVKFNMASPVGIHSSMTFNNVTFEYSSNNDYIGLQHAGDMVYNNCIINGQVFLYGTSETFNNCTFNQNSSDAYNVWTYGAKEVAFNECTFNSAGKSVLIYSEDKNLFNDVAVTKCTFKATSSVDGKAAIEMDSSLTRGIKLTIDGETTATGFDEGNASGNTLWNNKKGNNNDANNDITVIVDGETVLEPIYVAKIGEEGHRTLQEAINKVEDGETITLLADCDEEVTFTQTKDVSFVLDGNDKTYTGSINITARAGLDATSTLVIENFNFKTDKTSYDFIKSVEANYYPNNITITGCSFEGTSDINTEGYAVVAVRLKSANNIKIENCTGTGLHSFLQNTAGWNLTIDNVKVNNAAEGGFALGTVQGVTVKNCEINGGRYGIRLDGQLNNNAVIESNKINAYIPVIARRATFKLENVNFTFSGENVMEQTNDDDVWFVIENGNSGYHNGNVSLEELDPATGKVSVTLTDKDLNPLGIHGVVAMKGDVCYPTLQAAIDAATAGNNTINLLADVNENVTVSQVEGINIVIDGKKYETENYQFNGTIYIEGNSRYTGEETLTIQNVNFYTEKPDHDFIASDFRLEECVNPDEVIRYAHNVTVKDCNFATSETNENNTVVGLRLRQAYDIAVENCTSNYIFSLMWSAAVDGLALNNVTVEDCTEGITISGASKDVTIEDYEITSPSFGIRASVEGGQFTMTSSTINALVPVVVRNDNGITNLDQYNLSFTFDGTNNITENNPTDYWFVAGETEYKGADEVMPTAPKGNIIVNLNDNGLSYDGVYGNFAVAKIGDVQYLTFEAALNAVENGGTIELLGEAFDESGKEIDFTKAITFTIKGQAPEAKLPIITFQNAIVNIMDANFQIPELDARQNATINVINSTIVDAGGNSIVKSYYNGAINIDANSTVYAMQVTTMGYITVDGTLNATWQTNVYGNGLITLNKGATFNTAALHLTAKDYEERDNTDADRVGKPAEIVVDSANFIVGKVLSAGGADYSYNSSKGINIGTVEGKFAILNVKNGGIVNYYMANGETANIGAGGTVNVAASTFNTQCRAENGTVTLANNGTMNVTGEASINIKNLTGNNAINFTDVTIADAYIGGRVNAFGTNNINGTTIIGGILSLGYETNPSEQVVVNITGNFNGSNVIVSSNNGVDNLLNVGTINGERTTAYFGQLGAFADVNIVNSDVTYHYAFVRNNFNVTNSTMEITGGANTYFSGNAIVVLDNTTWNLPGFANIGSYGGYMYGKADVTLKNGSVMDGTNLGIEVSGENVVKVTLEDNSRLKATKLTNQGSIVLADVEAKVTSNELTGTNNVPTTTVADHKVVYENGAYVVTAKQFVAQIYDVNDNTNDDRRYESLQEAIEAVAEGETVKLMADVTITEAAYGQNALNHARAINFTLDLNGKTLSADTGNSVFRFNISGTGATDDVTVTIKNGTVVSGANTWCTLMSSGISDDVRAVMNLEDLDIENYKGGDFAVKAWTNGVVNAEGVTINSTYGGGFYAPGGEITLENCTVNQKGLWTAPYNSMAVAVSNGGKMTVNSGTYSAVPLAATDGGYQQGTSHGSWTGGVMSSGGTLIINGGTFSNGNIGGTATNPRELFIVGADADYGDNVNGQVIINGGTFTSIGDFIHCETIWGSANDPANTYMPTMGVTITAGDFTAVAGKTIGGCDPVSTGNPVDVEISGGTYGANHAIDNSYLVVGYIVVDNGNGTYSVVEDQVAKIGDVTYKLLQEAFNAAQDGDEIVVLKEIVLTAGVTVAADKVVVLDLNGKTISMQDASNNSAYAIKNNGNLTIKDSAEGGKITFNSTTPDNSFGYATSTIGNGGHLTIENGLIENTTVGGASYAVDGIWHTGEASLTINDGTITATKIAVRQVPFSATAKNTVTINGGTFTGATAGLQMFNINNEAKLSETIIKGGTFYGTYGFYTSFTSAQASELATINIDGGTFNGYVYLYNGNNGSNEYPMTVAITDGLFNSGAYIYTKDASGNEVPIKAITGGTFSEDPSEYCAEEFTAIYDEVTELYNVMRTSAKLERTLANAGWYWFSSYVNIDGITGLDKLKDALGVSGEQIKNATQFINYHPSSGWKGTLTSAKTKEMYQIKTTADNVTIYLEGSYSENLTIELKKGWNYLAYPMYDECSLNDALRGFTPQEGDIIKSKNSGNATYTNINGTLKWKGNLATLKPGEGYMYYSNSETVVSLTFSTSKSRTTIDEPKSVDYYWSCNDYEFASNMTVIAMLNIDDELVNDNYEIAAFANGECRGSARPVYVEEIDQYILFMTIHGEDVQELTFKYYDVNYGIVYELNNRINYSSDAVVGSIAEPYMLTRGTTGIGEAEMSQVNIYPNPTTTGKEINLQATCDKVEVFNALGAKVAEYQNVDSIDALETAGIYVIRITNDSNVQNCKLVVR